MTPDEYCEDRAAASGSSLYYSFLSLPQERRRALTALQSFIRETAEVVDECSDAGVARAKLHWWREELDRLLAGRPQHPITRALAAHRDTLVLPGEQLREIIDGAEMDLDYDIYPSFAELTVYCQRVGSVAGLLRAQVLGYRNRQTARFAHELGMALQLLRALRNVRADALKGRVYIPEDELRRFGVDHTDLLRVQTTERLRALFGFQAERIRAYHRRAFEQLPDEDRYAQRSHIALASIALTLLDEIEADGFRLLERRTELTPLRKFWLAWGCIRRERRRDRRLAR